MKEIIDSYETLEAWGAKDLDKKVNDRLQGGWKLYGEPRTLIYDAEKHVVLYIQTIVGAANES